MEYRSVDYQAMWINIREGEIKNRQSRKTGNIEYTRHKMKTDKTKNSTHYVEHHYAQTNTYNVNKT